MKRVFISFLIITNALIMNAQLRPLISDIADSLREYTTIYHEFVGISGETTNHYRNFEKLGNFANSNELIELANDTSLVVKGYATWALAERYDKYLPVLFEKYLSEETYVDVLDGCVVYPITLGDLLYMRVFQGYYQFAKDTISQMKMLRQLDSVYIFSIKRTHELDFASTKIFEKMPIIEENYNRLREIALEEKNIDALLALTKFRKPIDFVPIKDLLLRKLNSDINIFKVENIVATLLSFNDEPLKQNIGLALKKRILESSSSWGRPEIRAIATKHNIKLE